MDQGALSHITSIPGGIAEPKTEYFEGDGVTLVFDLTEAKPVAIHSVYVGGIRWREGVDYTKDDDLKRVTFEPGAAPLAGQTIDITFFV